MKSKLSETNGYKPNIKITKIKMIAKFIKNQIIINQVLDRKINEIESRIENLEEEK